MIKTAFFVFIILLSFIANAQNNQQQYGSDNGGKYVYYNQTTDKKADQKSKPEYRQLIKVCPQWLLEGNIPIFYERKIGKNITVAPSVGVTFHDYLWEIFEQAGNDGAYIPVKARYYKPGLSAALGFKYYPSGALNGFYIAPEVRYRNYQSLRLWNTYTNNPGTPKTDPENYLHESLVFTDLKFTF